jgi:hypothetical protein
MTPTDPDPDEFYIGYADGMPAGIGRRVRQALVVAAVMAAAGAATVLVAHQRLEPARFDFGRPTRVAGLLRHWPYPSLTVDRERLWLAGQGKHGAEALVSHLAEGPVTLHGALIARGRHRMLEVVPGSVAAAGGPAPVGHEAEPPGDFVTLTGEIVDAKCFLGVMNPGESTVHRDCARTCLLGGLPPMLLVRGARGEEALVLLVSSTGEAVGRDLADIAGQPVEVRGRLLRDDGQLVLYADRAQYRFGARTPVP